MKSIFPILLFNFLCLSSFMAILPVIGPIVREMGLSEWHSGLIVGVAGVFWMFFSRFWGKLSDQYGRRHTLIIATLGFIISYLALAIFIDKALSAKWSIVFILSFFTLFRGLMGAFYAAVPPVSVARIADATTPENKAAGMSLLGASVGLAMVFGPSLSGMLAKNSLVLPLYIAAFLPVLGIVVVIVALPRQKRKKPSKKLPIKLTDQRIRLPVLTGFFVYCATITGNMCIGFYGLDVLHLAPLKAAQTSGYTMGIVGIMTIITQLILSRQRHLEPNNQLTIGAFVAALGFLMIISWHTVLGLLIGYGISAIGFAFIFPAMQTLASNAVSLEEQGVAAGSIAATQGFAMIITPISSTMLYEVNAFLPYTIVVLLMLLLFAYAYYHKKITG